MRDLGLIDADDLALREAIRRKNTPTLMRLIDSLKIDATHQRALAQLSTLYGGGEILNRAECVNDDARIAVERLRDVLARLAQFGLADFVTLDLAENRGMEYYTGMMFEGFVHGLGFAIASGGRYDNLIHHFGPSIPAVGFAIGVERVLIALRSRGAIKATIAPAVIAQAFTSQVEEARAQGKIVEVDILNRTDNELREYARIRGAREIWWRDGRTENLE